MDQKRWHRVRFYPNTWSTFDEIKECDRPKACWGCEYKHPFCEENGRVPSAHPAPPRGAG